jgi:Tol biopolymer transport system component
VAVDLVAGAGEVTYVVGAPPPETVRVSVTCAQEVAVGESIPSCVQEALSAEFAAVVAMADGPPIAFVSERDGDSAIFTMRTDGTDVRQLTTSDESDQNPAWSPDGTRIVFASHSSYSVGTSELYTMRPDGTDMRHLTEGMRDDYGVVPGEPFWSPDGTRIVFAARGSQHGIYTMRADGTDKRRLTRNAFWDSDPAWSP